MNLLNKSILTLGLFTATAVPAAAEFAEPAGDQGQTSAIELANGDSTPSDHFGKMLDALTPAGLSESVLARHLRAALPANGPQSTAGGGGMGSETPQLVGDSSTVAFNHQHPASRITPFGDNIAAAGGSFSLAGAAIDAASHTIGSGYVTGAAPQAVASSSAAVSVAASAIAPQDTSVTTPPPVDTKTNPVPLPPAAFMFASGLIGLPYARRLITRNKG
jgi:hypothetical protein